MSEHEWKKHRCQKQNTQPQNSSPRSPRGRPTIGFLTYGVVDWFLSNLRTAVTDEARERDANILCFLGRSLRNPYGFEAQANLIYDLVSAENVDGLVISGILGEYIGPEEMIKFCARYRHLPMVITGLVLEGIPSVTVDNYSGMRDLVTHLVEVHGYRRVAFIRGPGGSTDVAERYQAYVDVLAEHGLPLDPDLIVSGDNQWPSGAAAVCLLLDERQVDFEVVVANNDNMALSASQALQARGIRVPGDVAVVGFDDIEDGWCATPPLTTVRYPVYESGKRPTEMLLTLLAGGKVPEQVFLPTSLVVRQSCGCSDPVAVQAVAEQVTAIPKRHSEVDSCAAILAARREHILSEMVRAVETISGGHKGTIDSGWTEQLLNAFSAELLASSKSPRESPGSFLRELSEILHQTMAASGDEVVWQSAVSALRRHLLPYLGDFETLLRAEGLCQQAGVMIGEMAKRTQAYRRVQAERRAQTLHDISQALITIFNVDELMDALARELPRLGVPRAYLSLYENPEAPAEWSKLILAYEEKGRVELDPGDQSFPSPQLVPGGSFPQDRQYNMVVEPLYFREDQLGFALFEVGLPEGMIYETLRGQISGALRGALLLEERKRAEEALGKAYIEVEKRIKERTAELQREIAGRVLVEEELRRYQAHLEELVKERAKELEEAQAELIRKERLSALGQLTATVAHEIRNPLGTVRTAVFAIGDAIERDEMYRVERALQLAERNIIRCDNIIRELLDYTRDRVLQLKPMQIDTWLDVVLDEQDIPEGIVCVRQLTSGIEVPIDHEYLRRAVINVIGNAVDALQDEASPGNQLTVSTHVVGSRLEIRVSDTGPGIPADVLAKVFEPLFSTKSYGVGLGLPIVKNIMQQHGGGVEVQSEVGRGTIIVLWLPV